MLVPELAKLIPSFAEQAGLHVALGDTQDDDEISSLNAAVAQAPLVMSRQEPDFFRAIRANGGAVIVLRDPDRVCGYSVLVPAGGDMPPFLPHGDTRIGILFGTAVREDCRRQGWQRALVALRVRAFAAIGIETCQAVVAPGNLGSMGNLFGEGFEVVAYNEQIAGAPRFIVERTTPPGRCTTGESISQPLAPDADAPLHAQQLAVGRRGSGKMVGGKLCIAYHDAVALPSA